MTTRPRFKAHTRPLRRGPGAVQFGVAPDVGMVLEGLHPAEIELLDRLDGTADLTRLYAVAATAGLGRLRVDELLSTLHQHRLLVQPSDRAVLSTLQLSGPARLDLGTDADALAVSSAAGGDGYTQMAARAAYRVLVEGTGALPDAISALLASTGVGPPGDGRRSGTAPQRTAHREAERAGDPVADPDLVVLTGAPAVEGAAGEHWLRRRVAHLPVVSLGHRVVIGPLVAPGGGPCLRCLDLHRADRDPSWPIVLAQLVTAPPRAAPPVRAETSLTAIAAGLTAMVVHSRIEGRDLPPGATLEIALPWPRVDHRRWRPHPRCPCAGGSVEEVSVRGVTMRS